MPFAFHLQCATYVITVIFVISACHIQSAFVLLTLTLLLYLLLMLLLVCLRWRCGYIAYPNKQQYGTALDVGSELLKVSEPRDNE